MTTKKKKPYRHGDVFLKPVSKATVNKVLQAGNTVSVGSERTIALGEVTGHHHTLYGTLDNAIIERILKDDSGERRFIELLEQVDLRHQEHKTLRINPGVYEIIMEREYDYFSEELRKVVD